MAFLYACLHCFLRSVYAMAVWLRGRWRLWKDEWLSVSVKDPSSVGAIARQTQHLPRIPTHLGLIPPSRHFTEADLVRIARWAGAIKGIRQVDQVEASLIEVSKEVGRPIDLSDLTLESSHRRGHDHGPGEKDGGTMGRERIAQMARELARERVESSSLGDSEEHPRLTVAALNDRISDPAFPDPELLILYGDEVELQGFPPWQIRLTEF
ncbi:hypothetical protein BJ684DRAFT_17130 [Piptocephalis cylindrospora]|uniref:ditrans,polycis-polyprenyl diphosphate synthase [(2E,6E)-farnesyldiphosphate specific] n=1 Tax=Piptocephalis cylindrospora TaxID=1907219 RepID=A0A4P9Y122_9FUNG|nr:hypothetical protein BJ684DRAFT_17130 [Piptocephalis cylindrospora]|eukprot:RKP12374.1 hypothetical protein BJ684DRAFT_17130 [Piptocephalis cylindrospora]